MHPHLRQIWLPLTPTIKASRALDVSIRLSRPRHGSARRKEGCGRGGWILQMTERSARGREEVGLGGQEARVAREKEVALGPETRAEECQRGEQTTSHLPFVCCRW